MCNTLVTDKKEQRTINIVSMLHMMYCMCVILWVIKKSTVKANAWHLNTFAETVSQSMSVLRVPPQTKYVVFNGTEYFPNGQNGSHTILVTRCWYEAKKYGRELCLSDVNLEARDRVKSMLYTRAYYELDSHMSSTCDRRCRSIVIEGWWLE